MLCLLSVGEPLVWTSGACPACWLWSPSWIWMVLFQSVTMAEPRAVLDLLKVIWLISLMGNPLLGESVGNKFWGVLEAKPDPWWLPGGWLPELKCWGETPQVCHLKLKTCWINVTGLKNQCRTDETTCLVGGLEHVFFHNIWDNPSRWPIFFRGVETTNQMWKHVETSFLFVKTPEEATSDPLENPGLGRRCAISWINAWRRCERLGYWVSYEQFGLQPLPPRGFNHFPWTTTIFDRYILVNLVQVPFFLLKWGWLHVFCSLVEPWAGLQIKKRLGPDGSNKDFNPYRDSTIPLFCL